MKRVSQIIPLLMITALAPFAAAQTPIYYAGGIALNSAAQNPTGPGNEDFNTASNWSTVPPNTFLTGGVNQVPGASNVVVIQADLNNGSAYYTSSSALLSGDATVPVVIDQTTQANTVGGFLVSNYGFVGQGSGVVTFNNTSGQTFTVNGTNAAGGDFVVDGGTTLNYTGGTFAVTKGLITIGDDETFTANANNILGGAGTFNVASGSFNFDSAAASPTQMIVGNSLSGTSVFGVAARGTVTQGASANVALSLPPTASTVTAGTTLILGYNSATGNWNLTNGSILQTGTLANSYLIALGSNGGAGGITSTGSVGTMTIDDDSSFLLGSNNSTVTTRLELGTVSSGAGASTVGGAGTIVQNGTTSVVNMFGTATTVEIGGTQGGTGTYILNGGSLNIGTNLTDDVAFSLGATAGSSGTLNQTAGTLVDGNASFPNSSTFTIGALGAGRYTLSGGTAILNNGFTLGANGTINLNGGLLEVADNEAINAGGTLNLGGGTLQFFGGSAGPYTYNFAGSLTGSSFSTSTIDVSAANLTSFTFGQNLTGSGGIDLVGSGATIFNFAAGANTYTGSTGINGGTLNATGADLTSALHGTIISLGEVSSPATLNLALGTGTTTLQQAFTGYGTLNVNFSGANETLVLPNFNEAVNSVHIVLGASGTGGTLQFFGGTVVEAISDNGSASRIAIKGSEPTTLLGANSFGGGTSLVSGILVVDSFGALGTGNLVVSAGTLETNEAHQINVGGGYLQDGGTLVINLNAAPVGNGLNPINDLLDVTGTASLGGSLVIDFGFMPVTGDQFTIVESGGGISGSFTTPIVNPQGYGLSDSVVGNNLVLTVTSAQSALPSSQDILHSFADGTVINDGKSPVSLILGYDGNFYGTTQQGGAAGEGTVYQVTPQGVVTILHNFGDGTLANDGNSPIGRLIQASNGNFYGTTQSGGSANGGTVFQVTPQGVTTILHSFDDGTVTNDGATPTGGLTEGSDGNFYGVTFGGGSTATQGQVGTGDGTVYQITPQGTVSILHSFKDGSVTNDGYQAYDALVQGADGNFYGVTQAGGLTIANYGQGAGTIFKITPLGVETILHFFGNGTVPNDGATPLGALVEGQDGNFYGTTYNGGSSTTVSYGSDVGSGTVYKVTPTGTVTILHEFADGTMPNDGQGPVAGLALAPNGNFYGVTQVGGSAGVGTIFQVTPQGVVTVLHNFGDGSVIDDASMPDAPVFQGIDGSFYGIGGGGLADAGAIFRLAPNLPVITSPVTLSGNVSVPVSYQVTGTNKPTTFSASTLPGGLSMDSSGLITGIPTTVGTTTVNLTLANSSGSASYPLTVTIGPLPAPAVTSIMVAYGSVGSAFTYTTIATNNATSYNATGLNSTGLAIDPSSGIISGTPTTLGTITSTLTATNGSGAGAPVNLVIQIFGSPPTISQEYNVMHHFNDGSVSGDGIMPQSILQAFDGNFYGAAGAGAFNRGVIFKMTVQGVVTPFYSFNDLNGSPTSLLQAADGTFYGVRGNLIFRLTASGQMTTVYTFGAGYSGINALIQGYDGNFYGTTAAGGTANGGSAFQMTPQGVVTILHNFGDGSVLNDGTKPIGSLLQVTDGSFYGATVLGGVNGGGLQFGTVYHMTANGTVTILHNFTVTDENPSAGLIQGPDNYFYGPTEGASGSVYKIDALGTYFDFGVSGMPEGGLTLGRDGNIYGTAFEGGTGFGSVFQMTAVGVVTTIHGFGSVQNDGGYPHSALIQSNAGNFYGVTLDNFNGSSFTTVYNGTAYSFIASQGPTRVPIFIGAAYATSGIYTPFSFTPLASFGVSGSGAFAAGNIVPAQADDNGTTASPSAVVPQAINKLFGQTNWTLSGILPNYLSFDSTSGTISGTPVQSGTFPITMTANNAAGSSTPQMVTLFIDVPPGITSSTNISTPVNMPFSYQIATTPPASSFGATGLPSWLSVNTTAGIISGTPPAAGSYIFNAVASNVSGPSVETVLLTVTGGSSGLPSITSPSVASISAGTPFNYQISTTPSATKYAAFALPTGLVFDSPTGTISGTPSAVGFFSVPLLATNAAGSYASALSLTILPATVPGIVNPLVATAAVGSYFSYQIPTTGYVTSYSETGQPGGLSLDSTTGIISGYPTGTGQYPVAITVGNLKGTSTSTLNLTVSTSMNFSGWFSQYHTLSGGPTDTPYHDGVPTLLKYFCNIDPTRSITPADRDALPTLGFDTTSNPGTEYLTLDYREYALQNGLAVNLQTSSDLQTWTTVTPDINQTVGTDPNTGDPIIEMGIVVTGSAQFIRLDVSSP